MQNLEMKKEFKVIADLLPNNIKVLDVGCGDGNLISYLSKNKNVDCRGIEITLSGVGSCLEKGLNVIQVTQILTLKIIQIIHFLQ